MADLPVTVVWKPVLLDAASIHRQMLDANSDPACVGVVAWMHTFSPAKMWIAGLDALQKPLLHLHTQAGMELPWSTIDMDFMNLNQAAHGDREFGYIQSRLGVLRKTVAGHVESPVVAERIGHWARAALGRHELRHLKLARFGDNMRDVAVTEGDKVEAQLRFGVSVNTYGVNDLVAVVDAVADDDIDKLVHGVRRHLPRRARAAAGGERHESLRYGARIELGLRSFLTAGGFGAFTTNFEDLGGLRQLPGLAVQRLMADGYGFGGEGDWKTSVLLRGTKVMAARPARRHVLHGGLHLPPGPRQGEDPRRPHARGLPDHHHPAAVARDPPARHRRPRGPGAPPLHRRPRPARSSPACPTWATASGSPSTRSTSSSPTRRCRTCPSPAPCGSRGRRCRPRPSRG